VPLPRTRPGDLGLIGHALYAASQSSAVEGDRRVQTLQGISELIDPFGDGQLGEYLHIHCRLKPADDLVRLFHISVRHRLESA
jgi:hypothetical protein